MIYLAADDHYGMRPGAALFEKIKSSYEVSLFEEDYSCFGDDQFVEKCDLLVLNLIGSTGPSGLAGAKEEIQVKRYCESGKNLLLLHGGSSAFWHWDWWRPIVGYRWVRGEDPDGFEASWHPNRPYKVEIAKSRHELCTKLLPMNIPEDEIYLALEQTAPSTILMTTTTKEGTFPMCYESKTPWGGKIIGFLPGHNPAIVGNETMVANVKVLIDYLLA